MKPSTRNAISAAARFLTIAFLITTHSIRFGVHGLYLLTRRRRNQLNTLFGTSLTRLFEALGPTFVKAGQILGARPDLLPDGVGAPLRRLQDQTKPVNGTLIPKIIEEAFGRTIPELFDSFDLTPIASASIAQVHRARLHDGRELAVKIRRPGIGRIVDNDLLLVTFMARTLSSLPGMGAVPLPELVDHIKTPLHQQLDFYLEADNNRRFRNAFAHVEHIKFPELVEELCSQNVLTMEYIDRLQRTDSTALNSTDRKTAVLAGLHALYKMIFIDGFIHADMHSGNVFVRDWGEFVILDLGLVARLDDKDRQDFVDFFFGLVNNDGRECARIILSTAVSRPLDCDLAAFESAIVELIANHSTLKSHEFEVAHFVYELIRTQRRFKNRGSTNFMMAILSMVVFDGICKRLYPECDFQKEARAPLITARYGRKPLRLTA